MIIIIGTFAGGVKETFRTNNSYYISKMSPPAHPPITFLFKNNCNHIENKIKFRF